MQNQKPSKPWVVTYYQSSKDGQWYGHIIGANGEITWATEGFVSEGNAKRAMKEFMTRVATPGALVFAEPDLPASDPLETA